MHSVTSSLLFFDLEFTAWDDSLKTNWSDPERPAEILQIGAVLYNYRTFEISASYSRWVKPGKNHVLSNYCKSLLAVEQVAIDRSAPLADVMGDFYRWFCDLRLREEQVCWLSWGAEDVNLWREDCCRAGALPPPVVTYCDLMRECALKLGLPLVCDREEAKALLRVAPAFRRHDALSDAQDLIDIYTALMRLDDGCASTE